MLTGPLTQVTLIAALKRHHVRAFVPDPRDAKDFQRAGNIVPGTVFDRDVTDAKGAQPRRFAEKTS